MLLADVRAAELGQCGRCRWRSTHSNTRPRSSRPGRVEQETGCSRRLPEGDSHVHLLAEVEPCSLQKTMLVSSAYGALRGEVWGES
jgi:hypothetical protein